MKSYIKLPNIKKQSDSSIKKRELSDNDWKEYIFYLLLEYYKEANNKEIRIIIQNQLAKPRAEIEKEIKKNIKKWLEHKSQRFDSWGFIINLESSSEGESEGFYDLKFQHSDWRKKYFSFEAKNLGKTKSISFSKSIEEYVYTKKIKNGENIEDGGMYRYFIGKYACDMKFGGMIGFIIKKTSTSVIKEIKKKIYCVYDNKTSKGKLIENKIINNSICQNENTFDSIHLRQNSKTDKDEKFILHHIIMDFVI